MRVNNFRKIIFLVMSIVVLLSLFFVTFQMVQAAAPYPNGVFAAGEEIFDDLVIEGEDVRVAGTVHGMLFAFGETIILEKTAVIDDDAFLFGNQVLVEEGAVLKGSLVIGGQNVTISTTVERSLFVGGATLDIADSAEINNNLFFGGFHLETGADTRVGRNLYSGTYQTILNGRVDQNVRIGAGAIRLNSDVGGDAILDVGAAGQADTGMQYWYAYMQQAGIPEPIESGLQVADSASIAGQLTYTSPSVAYGLEVGNVAGGVVYQTPQPENIVEAESQQIAITYRNPLLARLGGVLRSLITLMVWGAVALWLLPKAVKMSAEKAAAKPLNSAGVGLISMIVVYIGSGMLFGLVIFLSVFFGILSLDGLGRAVFFLGFTSLAWVVAAFTILMAYFSKLVVAYWLGNLVLAKGMQDSKYKPAVGLLIGIVMVVLVSAIPFIGWLVGLAITLVGLGAVWFYYKSRSEKITMLETE